MTYTEVKVKIDELKQQVEAQGSLNNEQLEALHKKFRLEWNFNANAMEGNMLTVEEAESVLNGILEVYQKSLKDVLEIKKHDTVIREILRVGKMELKLSEKAIKDIHAKVIYEEEVDKTLQLGQYKLEANEFINYRGEKHIFVSPEEVQKQMKELLTRTNEAIAFVQRGKKYAPHSLDVALNFLIDYMNIHPFTQGSERVGFILTNQILVALGYTPFWITDEENEGYYHGLVDILCYEGSKEPLFKHISELVLRSQQMVNDVTAGKSIDAEGDILNQIELLKKALKAKDEEQLKKVKSAEVITALYTDSLKAMYLEVDQKIKASFKDLFGEITTTYINVSVQEESEVLQQEILLDAEDILWNDVDGILSTTSLHGFKLANEAEAITIELNCEFLEAEFIVDLGDGYVISKTYEQGLDAEEIKEVANHICGQIIKNIKELH